MKNVSLGIFDPARSRRNPDFLGGFPPKTRSVLRNRRGIPRLSRVSSRAREGKTRGWDSVLLSPRCDAVFQVKHGDRALLRACVMQAAPKRPGRGVVFLMSRKIHDPLRSGRAVSPLAGPVLASVAPRSA